MVNDDGCLVRGGHDKTAGAHVYLMEELGDARMRCDQLVRYIDEASKLIENSTHRDHFFEVAGHLIQAIPQTLFRLQKALQAVALAATRIDYEEIKQELRPEKVEQLERVLQDVRIRQVRHRSQPWTPQQAVGQLRALAGKVNETGWLDRGDLINLILGLEVGSKTASDVGAAHILETLADSVENSEEVSRLRLAALLRRILADEILSIGGESANDEPRNPMERAAQEWKVEAANLFDQIRPGDTVTITTPQGQQVRGKAVMRGPYGWVLNLGGRHGRPGIASPENVVKVTKGRRTASEDEDKESRFEEGKPADPTKNMSPEEAKKWREMNEKHKDKFKEKEAVHKEAEVNTGRLKKFVRIIEDVLPAMKSALAKYEKDPAKYAPQLDNMATDAYSIGVAIRGLQRALEGKTASEDEDKESRFEEGKPADPTKNMSPEEAKKWREMNEKYDDKFKKDAAWKVDAAARFGRGVSADELAKQMNSAADVIYKARGQTRKVGELLQECLEGQPFGEGPLAGADDAVLRRTREVKKSLYDWDFQGGQAASGLEGLAIKVKKIPPYQRMASEDPWKVEAKDLPTELETGAKLKVLVRRGDWPPDMYRKGELAEVKKGGKVGDDIVVKMKNDAMSSGQHFKLQVNKDGTYKLVGDPKFRRELKVQKL